MASLVGQSENPDVAGVYGEGDGAGVWGKSRTWVGVIGETQSSNTDAGGAGVWGKGVVGLGVHGESQFGIGVVGDSNWIGVKGETKTLKGIGVLGLHNAGGSAVIGQSLQPGGIGIHGNGAHRAGFFEGTVEITGDLTVQGVSVLSLLLRIQQLENKVKALSSAGSGGTTTQASVSASMESFFTGGHSEKRLRIHGYDFKASEKVTLQITEKPEGQNSYTETKETTANANGNFEYLYTIGICNPHRSVAVQCSGQTSNKVSNTVTAYC